MIECRCERCVHNKNDTCTLDKVTISDQIYGYQAMCLDYDDSDYDDSDNAQEKIENIS